MRTKSQRILMCTRICIAAAVVCAGSASTRAVYAQAGMRQALEALDVDEDGDVEPEEITPLSRPFLERITEARRMSMRKDMPIEQLLEAARVYHALKNGVAGRRVEPVDEPTVRPFGVSDEEPLVPQFGLANMRYRYTQADLDEADRTLRRADRNDDGLIDRREAADAPWTHRSPFDMDMNGDGQLSRLELAQRYARRRLLEGAASELVKKARRTGSEAYRNRQERRDDDRRRRPSRQAYYLASKLMERFDRDRSRRLERSEAEQLGVRLSTVDLNRDGVIDREELYAFTEKAQQEASAGEGIPSWFYERDANKDSQIAMSEFTDEWDDEKFVEFETLDANNDGLLTLDEVGASAAMTGGSFANLDGMMIPPQKTVISEITVTEDFLIRDLDIELSLTHSYVSHLDIFLIGPDGREIELCTAVGGSDDNFNRTIFDDQGRTPINRAKAPFEGSHIPEALLKRKPSLGSYTGKSVEGVWQLSIRGTRNERFGMLHHWSLHVKPLEDQSRPAEGQGSDAKDTPSPGDSSGQSNESGSGPSASRTPEDRRGDGRRDRR